MIFRIRFIFLCAVFLSVCVQAVGKKENFTQVEPLFRDGKGYYSYKKPVEVELPKDGKILIQYFFKYDCEVCLNGDDYLKQYTERNKDKVILNRSPAFDKGEAFTAQMHSSFEALKRNDLSDLYLFDSAGRKEAASLVKNNEEILKWLTAKGIEPKAFYRLFDSDSVKQKVNQELALFKKYSPPFTPIAILNGKYLLLQNTLYNDDYTYGVLDFLVEKLQQEQREDKR